MVRGPYTSDTLANTRNGLVDLLEPLPACIPQKFGLLQDCRRLHVLNANGFVVAINVVADHGRMFPRLGRHGELDLRVRLGELW